MTRTATTPPLTIVPANEATCEDLQAVFGTHGYASTCQCRRFKLRPRESFASFASIPAEERAARLCEQTDCGHPESDTTSGLVAYLDGGPSAGARSSRAPPTRACCASTASPGWAERRTRPMTASGR